LRKIILDLAVSLDGFIEGPNGETDWCILEEEMGFDQFLADIDTIFYGRVSYEVWGQYQPGAQATLMEREIWKQVHSKKKYVFSKSPKPDYGVSYISLDIAAKVREIKNESGKNIWLYGGASLINSFVEYGLIDAYRLSVHPVVLGAGKPLFSNLKERINLMLAEVKVFTSGVTLLSYIHQEK
jgi:dihydrofolate reductase